MTMRKLLAASAMSLVFGVAANAAMAAEPDSCKTIRMADVGWTDNTAQNGLLKNVVKPLGYEVKEDVLGLPIILEGLKNKDLDLFLDNWMPSNAANVQPYLDEKSIDSLQPNLVGAGYGPVVPQYVADAGVKSLADLAANTDKFEGKFYGIEPGNDGNKIIQAKIAIGSGGFDGVGIGNGVQKAFYLPEAHTDMISAVIGEEFGFLGMFALILVYGMLGYAGFQIARKAKDDYGRILAGGLTGLILIQACINLYAVMGMAPLTGIPLPLVSYGNNSLIVSLISIGLILNVGRGGRAATLSKPVPRRGPRPNARLRLIEGEGQRKPTQPARRTSGAERRDSGRRYGGARGSSPRHSRRASR